jgi:hypothetical protein
MPFAPFHTFATYDQAWHNISLIDVNSIYVKQNFYPPCLMMRYDVHILWNIML